VSHKKGSSTRPNGLELAHEPGAGDKFTKVPTRGGEQKKTLDSKPGGVARRRGKKDSQ